MPLQRLNSQSNHVLMERSRRVFNLLRKPWERGRGRLELAVPSFDISSMVDPVIFRLRKATYSRIKPVACQRAQIPRFPSNAARQGTPNREEFPANNAKKGFLTRHVTLCPQFKLTHFTVTSPRIKLALSKPKPL